MLVVLTTGQFEVWRCIHCHATFTGPQAGRYFRAHQLSHGGQA